jgi:hypothetical protein
MIRLAITGHRTLHTIQAVSRQIDLALAQLAGDHQPPWIIYSSLAEGADRLVVERIFARYPAQLIVPLPVAEEEYIKDFSDSQSVLEFKHWMNLAHQVVHLPTSPRPQAYLLAGLYMLDHCDHLIAVWDGLPARGPGGAGQIVEQARRRSIPVTWVKIPSS